MFDPFSVYADPYRYAYAHAMQQQIEAEMRDRERQAELNAWNSLSASEQGEYERLMLKLEDQLKSRGIFLTAATASGQFDIHGPFTKVNEAESAMRRWTDWQVRAGGSVQADDSAILLTLTGARDGYKILSATATDSWSDLTRTLLHELQASDQALDIETLRGALKDTNSQFAQRRAAPGFLSRLARSLNFAAPAVQAVGILPLVGSSATDTENITNGLVIKYGAYTGVENLHPAEWYIARDSNWHAWIETRQVHRGLI